jgi:flagellar hook-associated protein 3 FlgL
MRSTLDSGAELFLANMARAQDRLGQAQRQLSSGRKLETVADSPDEVGPLLQLRAALAHNSQIESNLTSIKTEANAAEQALSAALKLIDRATTVASQATSTLSTADVRHNLALEVEGIQEQMLALAGTQSGGRYIFSGDLDQYPAYQLDLTAGTGVVELTTAWATRRVEDPGGGSFATSRTARDIFDLRNPDDTLAEGNVFNALNQLRLALEADDTSGIETALALTKKSAEHINSEITFYGSVQNRVQQCVDTASAMRVRLQTALSETEDADITAVALELTQANLQVQTALAARAQVKRTSLFDVLG